MRDLWKLPESAVIAGKTYRIHSDYRDVLEIFAYLQDPDLPEFIRWQIALALFFGEMLPEEAQKEGTDYFRWFINGGREEPKDAGPRLLDWQQDAVAIIADVNKAAGQEIRALPFLHWWTFLSWFHAIGEGQVSMLVGIREKLRRGKKLEEWERQFCRRNKVELAKKYSAQERAEQERLQKLLE